jgi:hypothetical protein
MIPGDLLSISVRMVEAENRVVDCCGVLTGTSNSSGDPDEQGHPVVNRTAKRMGVSPRLDEHQAPSLGAIQKLISGSMLQRRRC